MRIGISLALSAPRPSGAGSGGGGASIVEFLGTQIGTSPTNAFDGDTSTHSALTAGQFVGRDLGSASTATKFLLAPRASASATIHEREIVGALLLGSNDSGFVTSETLATIAAFPFMPRNQYSEIPVTPTQAYRYYGLKRGASNVTVAEVRIVGTLNASAASRPAPVTISPHGGFYPSGTSVTITCPTRGAAIYYTLDGSTPDNTKTLYTGAFSVSGTKTLKAIAYRATLSTPYSIVSNPAYFLPQGFGGGQDMYDTAGVKIEAHGGWMYPDAISGRYWWFGAFANVAQSGSDVVETIGIWLYSTTDAERRNGWRNEGQILSTDIWTGMVRPRVLWNASTSKYVLWTTCYNLNGSTPSGATNARCAAIATASSINGPWTWYSTTYVVNGASFLDFSVYQEGASAWLVAVSNNAPGQISIIPLGSDYKSASAAIITIAGNREAPCIFKLNGVYYLISSLVNYYGASGAWDLVYSFAWSLAGPWAPYQSLPESSIDATVYDGQSNQVLDLGSGKLMFGIDQWSPTSLYASKYVFEPLTNIGAGMLRMKLDPDWSTTDFPAETTDAVTVLTSSMLLGYWNANGQGFADGDALATIKGVWLRNNLAQSSATLKPLGRVDFFKAGSNAITFDGANDFVSATLPLPPSGPVWVFFAGTTNSTATTQNIFSDIGTGITCYIVNGSLALFAPGSPAIVQSGGASANIQGLWIIDGASSKIYRNGSLVASGTVGASRMTTGLVIGNYQGTGAPYFNGSLALAAVGYGTPSSSDISALFAASAARF